MNILCEVNWWSWLQRTIIFTTYATYDFCLMFTKNVQKCFMLTSLLPSSTGSITPTVELNGLAMKRGEPAIYRPLDPKPMPNYRANYNFRGMFNQRWAHHWTSSKVIRIHMAWKLSCYIYPTQPDCQKYDRNGRADWFQQELLLQNWERPADGVTCPSDSILSREPGSDQGSPAWVIISVDQKSNLSFQF